MKRCLLCVFSLALWIGLLWTVPAFQAGAQEKGQAPPDKRLGPPKTLNDYFPFTPPATREAWEKRRQQVQEQVLVANGLWPLPKKTPLNAVIHGKIERGGYTVEKVYFQSYPGFYVTGNLYRPTDLKGKKVPGVLCPHGHWNNGRFYEASAREVEQALKSRAERTPAGAKYPLQARCANLALMGCVVFHYDMVGYADSKQIPHREGFKDVAAELWLQSFMGVQTWDSVRALDFLLSLPEVDPHRIGVTGASGGGTQTFLLGVVDSRPTVAFPAVMVSTAMQGGCVCENCSYLRVGTGNVEFAGAFAPRPLGMSGANDWTKEIETKGYPELKKLYSLYNAEDKVKAKAWIEFPHNYNQVAREFMYTWFNKHLNLGQSTPVVERPFVPVPPKELTVWDDQHTMPKNAKSVKQLRQYLTLQSKEQMQALFLDTAAKLKEFRHIEGTALRVMMDNPWPVQEPLAGVGGVFPPDAEVNGYVTRGPKGDRIPVLSIVPGGATAVVVWVHPEGRASIKRDGKLVPEVIALLKKKIGIVVPEVFLTGETGGAKAPPVDKQYAGFTWGYNRTVLANRVHDILTAVAFARQKKSGKQSSRKVHLVGFGEAGPWVLLARALCGDAVDRTAADMNQFRFKNILNMNDPMMQPGALRYGGLPAFTALCAPHPLFLHNTVGADPQGWVAAAYQAAGQPGQVRQLKGIASPGQVVEWLVQANKGGRIDSGADAGQK
jgi:dienelactone hydrolase